MRAFILIALFAATSAAAQTPSPPHAIVRGTIVDSVSRTGISGASIEIPGTRFTARSSETGAWVMGRIPAGSYTLRVTRLGYAPRIVGGVQVVPDAATTVDVALTQVAVPLAAMVVTPGFYGLLTAGVTPSHALTRQQLESAPQLGEDIYRSIGRLPGVSSNDMSARFSVRSAGSEQLYATLDGLELDEPFHLKDIDAALSILDVSAIAGLDMSTGGFTSEYGNKIGGVLNFHTVDPRTDRTHHALSLSIMNARYTGQGKINANSGWFVSARRGYLDIALKLVQEDDSLKPRYHDVFAKAYYDLPGGNRFTLHALSASDKLTYAEDADVLRSKYGTNYLWATLDGNRDSRLRHSTLLSTGRLGWTRGGDVFANGGTRRMLLDDERRYDVSVLRSDWQLDIGASALLKAGFEGKIGDASYDYFNWLARDQVQGGALVTTRDTTQAVLSPDGTQLGAYLSQRLRLTRWLTAETGVRYDHADWTAEGELNPRLNVVLTPLARTTVRASIGRYSQPQQLHELFAGDGQTTFGPSEIAIHRAVAIEQRLTPATTARAELYQRSLSRLRPRWVNQDGDIEVFPETELDRLRLDPTSGEGRGLELMLQHDAVRRVAWSASYTIASATERIGNRDVPRQMDQRHSFSADWAYRPVSNRWLISAATLFHSGWPATPRTFFLENYTTSSGQAARFLNSTYGTYGSERLPAYKRVDVRFTRYWDTARGRVAMYADVFNLLGAANARGYNYRIFNIQPLNVQRAYEEALPRLPSIGLSWEF